MKQMQVRLMKRPRGQVEFGEHLVFFDGVDVDEQLEESEILVKVLWLSIDPAMRGWMTTAKSYLPPAPLGEPMRTNGVGSVISSKSQRFKSGDFVVGFLGMQEYAKVKDRDVGRARSPHGLSPKLALSVLGNNGYTAYFGFLDVGKPVKGDTVVVSAAAGATGSIVAQISKHVLGCRTVGIAGGPDKVAWLKDELKLDAVIDYKNVDVRQGLKAACPDGIDVYFDNVGGTILDEVLRRINQNARVVLCGAISSYNMSSPPPGPSHYVNLIPMRAKMEGFIVLDYADRYREAQEDLGGWIADGKLKFEEDISHGLASAPQAFDRLFTGKNTGKVLIQVASDANGLKSSL